MIKIIYTILLGIILAFFVGLGIEAFYPTPVYPETPAKLQYMDSAKVDSPETIKAQQEQDKIIKDYQTKNANHARVVSAIAVIGSIIYMILSLWILRNKDIFADGFLTGSLLTLLYGIMRGFESSDKKFQFIVVTIGVAIALCLGYFKFLKPEKSAKQGDK